MFKPPTTDADLIASLQAQLVALQGELKVVRVERDLLRERVAAFEHRLFAARSEVRHADQRDLFFNEAEMLDRGEAVPEEKIGVPAHNRSKRGRKPLDPALEREIIRHELPEAERTCAHDGSALVEIGVEVSEQLDIVPAKVRVIRHERVKYACPCCDNSMRIAPVPVKLIPRSLLTEKALAWIATAKYQDGLPLYRQAALIGPLGGHFCRNTLAHNMVRAGMAVQPVINLMRDQLLDAGLLFGDETELQVLKEPGRTAQTKSYLWLQMSGSGPPVCLFTYSPSRSAKTALLLYEGASGALMSDGYAVYDTVASTSGLVHLGCWAHARRAFVEAEAIVPKAIRPPDHLATRFIAAIGELYAIEAKWREAEPAMQTVEERLRLRQAHGVPALARLETLLLTNLHAVTPESKLGRALHYLAGQWSKLVRYVEDGRYPIDNNPGENAIRPFVVGRKNWLFSDTVAGAQASANLYSLIETCKANRVEPYRYLCELFAHLPHAQTVDDIEALLPWNISLPN